MKRHTLHIIFFLLLLTGRHGASLLIGQRISFGTWSYSGIEVYPVVDNYLNFGNLIIGGSGKTINIQDATAFRIKAPEGFDLTITLDAPAVLTGPDNNTIPLSLKLAWSNQGISDATLARSSAIELMPGFSSVTIPVRKNSSGPASLPPDPITGGATRQANGTVYLYVYGSVGAPSAGLSAGSYSAEVSISIEYTVN